MNCLTTIQSMYLNLFTSYKFRFRIFTFVAHGYNGSGEKHQNHSENSNKGNPIESSASHLKTTNIYIYIYIYKISTCRKVQPADPSPPVKQPSLSRSRLFLINHIIFCNSNFNVIAGILHIL